MKKLLSLCFLILFTFTSFVLANERKLLYEITFNLPCPSYKTDLSYAIWEELYKNFDTKFIIEYSVRKLNGKIDDEDLNDLKVKVDELLLFLYQQGLQKDMIIVQYIKDPVFAEFSNIKIYIE